jgi:hypothetical protein
MIIESPLTVRYKLHDSNYQVATWKKADCPGQLEEIQRLIMSYAGLTGDAAESLMQQRLSGLLDYIVRESERRGEHELARQYRLLLKKPAEEDKRPRYLNFLSSLKRDLSQLFRSN